MASQQPSTDVVDYSPAATLILFDHPISLLRWPIKASSTEEPESGPFLLAFKNPRSWASAYKTCESLIIKQCENGARIGCSISASSKCQSPWWKILLGFATQDYAERARCEEHEMEACVAIANVKCCDFAKEKCLKAFKDARIASMDLNLMVNRKEAAKLISWACLRSQIGELVETLKPEQSWNEFRCQFELSCCKGSDLLVSYETDVVDLYFNNW